MNKSTEEQVIKTVAEVLGMNEAELNPESKFVADLGADSLDMVEVAMGIEDDFEPTFPNGIPDEAIEKITTVQDLIDYVKTAKGETA